MRALAAAILLAISVPGAVAAQGAEGRVEITAQPLADTLLVWILNSAVEVPIDGVDGSLNLIPRLYAISDEGGCVEDTHMICSHRYFLAVAEEGAGGAQAVFDLGEVGEIVGARVMVGADPVHPHLALAVQNYPDHAFQYNPTLVRQKRIYVLTLDVKTLRIDPKP